MPPGPAVDKEHDGEILLIFGKIKVELVLDGISIRPVIISKVQLFANFESCLLARCGLFAGRLALRRGRNAKKNCK
jgi:hypothetical protein